MHVRKIILDTDPGGDDIFALLWIQSLLYQNLIELEAITTVGGNVAATRTFASASQILDLGRLSQIEIGRGVEGTTHETADASHIHGADGMGNLSSTLAPPCHAYDSAPSSDDLIIRKLQAHPGEITLIAIGPLTNLAAAEGKRPGILKLAKEIVVMGGAMYCRGNTTAHAEFNIWFNPVAAETVFGSRDDIVVIPLDVTTRLVFTPDMVQLATRSAPESPLAVFIQQLFEFMVETALGYRETNGARGFLVHDAATLAYLFYPETLLLRRSHLQVETEGTLTRGQTLIDRRHGPKATANAWVAMQVDVQGVFSSLVEDLNHLVRHLASP